MSLSCQKMWATKRWKHPVFVEENLQPTDQDMEWTQSFSKAIVICTFWHSFWNSCFVSGTHVIPCYTWFVLVSYGFSVFSVSYGWANFRRPAAPAAPPIAITGPAECPYEAGRFGTLASSIQLNNHSDYRFLAVFFFVVHWCFFLFFGEFLEYFFGDP